MNPLTYLPAKVRAVFYGVYATVGVVFGAIQAYDTATAAAVPNWLNGSVAVYGYVGIALGVTALSNLTKDTEHGPKAVADPAQRGADENRVE